MLAKVHSSDSRPGQRHREESEITAAADGEIHAEQARGPDGELDEARAPVLPDFVRKTGRRVIPVAVVPDRINTRVVAEALGHQDLVGPRLSAANGKVGCAVANYYLAANVLEQGLGAMHIGAELRWRLARDELVAVTMTGDLVSLSGDLPDEVGMIGRDLAQDKE